MPIDFIAWTRDAIVRRSSAVSFPTRDFEECVE